MKKMSFVSYSINEKPLQSESFSNIFISVAKAQTEYHQPRRRKKEETSFVKITDGDIHLFIKINGI